MPLFGRDLMKAFNITWSQTNFVKGDFFFFFLFITINGRES